MENLKIKIYGKYKNPYHEFDELENNKKEKLKDFILLNPYD